MEQLKMRYNRRPTLHERQIQLMSSFDTNTCIINVPNKDLSIDLIDLYFSSKICCGVYSIEGPTEKEPFVLIKFDSAESVRKILSQKHEISEKKVIVEYMHNYKLLNEPIKQSNQQISSQEHTLSSKIFFSQYWIK